MKNSLMSLPFSCSIQLCAKGNELPCFQSLAGHNVCQRKSKFPVVSSRGLHGETTKKENPVAGAGGGTRLEQQTKGRCVASSSVGGRAEFVGMFVYVFMCVRVSGTDAGKISVSGGGDYSERAEAGRIPQQRGTGSERGGQREQRRRTPAKTSANKASVRPSRDVFHRNRGK